MMLAGQLLKIEVLDHIVIGHPTTQPNPSVAGVGDSAFF